MPRRTPSQRTGSLGHRIAASAFERLGNWIVRNQEEDFGIDMELELSDPDPSGHFLKCQVKSLGRGARRNIQLKNDFLRYVYECRLPIILAQVDVVSENVWVCWLQGCIEMKRLQQSIYGSKHYTEINSEWLILLDNSASEQLKLVARGIHPISRGTQVRDLIRFALESHDHDLVDAANNLLFKYRNEISHFPLELLVDEILAIGNRIWGTIEGNALSKLLYILSRSYGDNFTKEQIRKLALRDESYSRTGINALGIMYDEFPEHMRKLQLGTILKVTTIGALLIFAIFEINIQECQSLV